MGPLLLVCAALIDEIQNFISVLGKVFDLLIC